MKKWLSVAVSMVLSLLFSSCFNDGNDLTFHVVDGNVEVSGLKDGVSIKVLNIPSMVKTEEYETECQVTAVCNGAFRGNEVLEEIIFPEGISIGIGAFEGCTNLRKIVFTGSNGCIKSGAFANCSNLQEVIGLKNNEDISYGAFEGCTNLKNKNDILPRERTINIRLENFNVSWGGPVTPSHYYCNVANNGFYTRNVSGILTKEIVVPDGERWIYKDHSVEFSTKDKTYLYYDPYIRRKFKGRVKEYKLPKDGRDFALYAGDVFQIGAEFVFAYYEYADISVVFTVYYED